MYVLSSISYLSGLSGCKINDFSCLVALDEVGHLWKFPDSRFGYYAWMKKIGKKRRKKSMIFACVIIVGSYS